MKIAVKSEKLENLDFDDITPGMVFEYSDGTTALKLLGNEAVLLTYSTGDIWLGLAIGYKTCSIKRILGYLTEITVE